MSRTPEDIARILYDMYEDEEGGDYESYCLPKAWLRDIADMSRVEDSTIQKIREILLDEYSLYLRFDPSNDQFGLFSVSFGPGLRRLSEICLRQHLGLNGPRAS